jgi:DNA-binding beta-propeller fold protein YncE
VLHIAIPGTATGTPGISASPPPVTTLVVPAGVPLSAGRVFSGTAGAVLQQPQEAVRGKDGSIYVADTGNRRVAVFNRTGRLVRSITAGMDGPLLAPFSLALTPRGHLLVLDSDAGVITEYDGTGTPVRESARGLSLGHARGIATDAKGDVLVADPASNAVLTLSSDFTLVHTQPAKSGSGPDIFDQPSAVAVAANGTIYVMDSQNNRIEQFTRDWQLQYAYPLIPTDTQHAPHMLPLADGRLLVTDPRDDKLLLFGPAGDQPQAFALTGPSAAGPRVPLGLAADTLPNVLVTCNGSGQVWRVKVPGI